jgi:hypothetical protein
MHAPGHAFNRCVDGTGWDGFEHQIPHPPRKQRKLPKESLKPFAIPKALLRLSTFVIFTLIRAFRHGDGDGRSTNRTITGSDFGTLAKALPKSFHSTNSSPPGKRQTVIHPVKEPRRESAIMRSNT